jgi:hypothetical protein
MSFGRIPGIVALLALAGAPVNLWSYLEHLLPDSEGIDHSLKPEHLCAFTV